MYYTVAMPRFPTRRRRTTGRRSSSEAFKEHFRQKSLRFAIDNDIGSKSGRGIDKMTPQTLRAQAGEHTKIIYRKVHGGTYRFSPFLEILKTRGAERYPRVISFPTARDRVVLLQLKTVLHEVFPEYIPRTLPNELVRNTILNLSATTAPDSSVLRADIRDFYPTIPHDALLSMLENRIKSQKVLTLIERALKTPTVPSNYRKADLDTGSPIKVGIPQGLSISNILANIYLGGVDATFNSSATYYCRYVDDVIVLAPTTEIECIRRRLEAELGLLGLTLNSEKTAIVPATSPIEFLGYRFEIPVVSVRKESTERFLSSIAALATSARYNIGAKARTSSANRIELLDTFIEDVNEKITGAIYQKRRYGWLFYFLELNDLTLLGHMDAQISRIVKRLGPPDAPTHNLKRLQRAYHEAKRDPLGGYIRVYDQLSDSTSKREYLRKRGHFEDGIAPTDEEIDDIFEIELRKTLGRLERDIGRMS